MASIEVGSRYGLLWVSGCLGEFDKAAASICYTARGTRFVPELL